MNEEEAKDGLVSSYVISTKLLFDLSVVAVVGEKEPQCLDWKGLDADDNNTMKEIVGSVEKLNLSGKAGEGVRFDAFVLIPGMGASQATAWSGENGKTSLMRKAVRWVDSEKTTRASLDVEEGMVRHTIPFSIVDGTVKQGTLRVYAEEAVVAAIVSVVIGCETT
jgi:hypothetical protein